MNYMHELAPLKDRTPGPHSLGSNHKVTKSHPLTSTDHHESGVSFPFPRREQGGLRPSARRRGVQQLHYCSLLDLDSALGWLVGSVLLFTFPRILHEEMVVLRCLKILKGASVASLSVDLGGTV